MKITFKQCQIATAIIVALSLSSCARFENRMKANGTFDYQQAALNAPYKKGDLTTAEARNQYDIPSLTEDQKVIGQTGADVDVRPPAQMMGIIDGVLLADDKDGRTKIWFNSQDQSEQINSKVLQLIESYLAENNIPVISKDTQGIQTGTYAELTTFGGFLSDNTVLRESTYQITLDKQSDGHRIGVIVDVLSYSEINEEEQLKVNLNGATKSDIELRFVNKILQYAYQQKQSEQLAAADTRPLAIKLGFDDNHQSAWLSESDFEDTWRKLPALFTLLNFELVDHDKNLGYFLLKYTKVAETYWAENKLQPFVLDNGEYFIQLGEVNGGVTSIGWLDEDKKPLSNEKITELYLSITEHVRDALIEKDKQTKKL